MGATPTWRKLGLPRMPTPTSPAEVVRSKELAAMIVQFRKQWRSTRPIEEVDVVSADQYLSERSAISVRTLARIVACEYANTSIETADAIVVAMEEPAAFGDGRLHVLRNPRWKPEDYADYLAFQGVL